MEFVPHVIDGQETESASGERFASVDPWTREPWAEVALGGADDADRAVRAARRAFDEGPWPRMGHGERGALLHRFADLIEANAEMLALADSTDMGKPVSDARTRTLPI
jgi:aminomuconate-semialdehyde/2-hydroxymuconate-6-semialdehyde dehydrogenase